MTKLPKKWATSSLLQLASFVRGVTYKKADATKSPGKGFLPVLRATNIAHSIELSDLNYLPSTYISDQQKLRRGDVLIATSSGSKSVVGKAALVTTDLDAGFGAFCAVLRPTAMIESRLLARFFETDQYRKFVSEAARGVNINNLKRADFKSIAVPVPPSNEQQRIADKLDQLFSQIEKGEENLRRVEALVKRYRQSVLKAAVTGELTREWRGANSGNGETGEQLLQRILKARREAWETAELAKLKARGKTPKNDTWKQKYKEPEPPDTSDLPELPEGWVWASLDQLVTGELTNGLSVRGSDTPPGVPALKLDALSEYGLDTSRRRYLQVSEAKAEALSIREGDLLISRANGSLRLLARARLVGEVRETIIFPDTIIRARLPVFGNLADFVVSIWESPLLRDQIATKAKTSAGIWKVSQSDLRALALPLPGENECGAICAALGEHMVQADLASASCKQEGGRVKGLRQSILRAAFSGKLVPQDPNDEPASVLLERIAAERAAQDAVKPKRGRRPRRKEAAE